MKLLFVVDAKLESGLNKGKFTDDWKTEFKKQKIPLADGVTVAVIKPGLQWAITDKQNRKYIVEKSTAGPDTADTGVVLPPTRSGQSSRSQLRILGS